MKSRNKVDIFGYCCEFKRICFLDHKNRENGFCYLVLLNGVLIGTVHYICGHGTQLASLVPDGDPKVYRGYTRTEAVRAYIKDNLILKGS